MNERSIVATDLEPERYELREEPRYRFELDRREFLNTLGGGILVFYLLDAAEAQPPGGRRRGGGGRGQNGPQDIGAWLHIGEDEVVKVFTGKTEVGQNIRTSLTQAVAEELRVAPGSIQMIMADTQLVPFDRGTFGSQTTPIMSLRLRVTAAAAREALIDFAAETWQTDRALLSAANGAITNSKTKESLTYGKLTKGRKLTKVVADGQVTTSPEKWTIAGHSTAKVDGRSFVTGQHQYSTDIRLPGMWFGKVLRPPTIGASLAAVDTSAATAMTDVVVVRDGDFVGVAAPSETQAARALASIKAEWKPGPRISGNDLFDDLKRRGRQAREGRGNSGQRGGDRKSTRLNSSHCVTSRMPSSA